MKNKCYYWLGKLYFVNKNRFSSLFYDWEQMLTLHFSCCTEGLCVIIEDGFGHFCMVTRLLRENTVENTNIHYFARRKSYWDTFWETVVWDSLSSVYTAHQWPVLSVCDCVVRYASSVTFERRNNVVLVRVKWGFQSTTSRYCNSHLNKLVQSP